MLISGAQAFRDLLSVLESKDTFQGPWLGFTIRVEVYMHHAEG